LAPSHLLFSIALLSALGGAACTSASSDEDASSGADAITEDPNREPQVVHVPVRFTRNDVSDVGYTFSSSWVPFTSVKRDKLDGWSWGYSSPSKAETISKWLAPDVPGAGYATAYFRLEIPYDTTGKLAYGLARVKLEREFISTEMASTMTRKYSPLRIRAGSDQPCLSITMSGRLDGKMKPVPIPFTDEGFTERDWKVGDKDGSGRPIEKVIVATLGFSAYCWPENVEGSTHGSGGAAVPGAPVFAMVDKTDGQGGGDSAVIHVNLVENDRGKVSVGEAFSSNGGILSERNRRKFDEAVVAFKKQFDADMKRGIDDHVRAVSSVPPF
jgi:hypothetical protein